MRAGGGTCVKGRRRVGGDHLKILRLFALVRLSTVAVAYVNCEGRVG